jgi:hypothetical protein
MRAGSGTRVITLNPGDLLYGRLKAEEQLQIPSTSVFRALQKFEQDGMISIESDIFGTRITICNWESYQGFLDEVGQATDKPRNTYGTPTEHVRNAHGTPTEPILESIEGKESIHRLKEEQEVRPNFEIQNPVGSEIQIRKNPQEVPRRPPKSRASLTLFRETPAGESAETFETIWNDTPYAKANPNIDPHRIWQALRDWSDSGNHKKADWIATGRTFANRAKPNEFQRNTQNGQSVDPITAKIADNTRRIMDSMDLTGMFPTKPPGK